MQLGLMAGELVIGGMIEGVRRVGTSAPDALGNPMLNARTAKRIAERLSHMRGAAMKLGQLLSLEGPDFLPPDFAAALSMLRAGADPMPHAQLRRVLGREYGSGWETRFAHFEFEPVAAASIGQVHYAVTADGREVALKIQYPGVAQSIDSDVENVTGLLRLLKLLPGNIDVRETIAEAKRQLHQEADYIKEAELLLRYRKLVADEPRLRVPQVYEELSTKRILAMDFVIGQPLEALASEETPQARRDAMGRVLMRLLFRELFEFRFMQTDPNFANYLYDPVENQIVLLDFGSVRRFESRFVSRFLRLCKAIIANDRDAVRRLATEIGYFQRDDPDGLVKQGVELIMLVCEPLRHRGVYDFAQSKLPQRAREAGFDLLLKNEDLRAPPPETLFLHRKLAGSFLIMARIGARVNVHNLVSAFLP
jgi:predicted unusual protein kinase regulating ubiquinone biosynthesis (AarF/ABC1/UbiB family)